MSYEEEMVRLEEQKAQLKDNISKLKESKKELETLWGYIKRGGLFKLKEDQ